MDAASLSIDNYKLWSDSQTVIQWCSNTLLELRVFERNRVDSIMKNSKKLPRYVPSEDYPEDVATLRCRPKETKRWNLWTKGPELLYDMDVPWLKTSLGLSDEECEAVPTACSFSMKIMDLYSWHILLIALAS